MIKHTVTLLVAVIITSLSGCGGGSSDASNNNSNISSITNTTVATASAAPVSQSNTPIIPLVSIGIQCADFYQTSTEIGNLTNNVWNKQAAGNYPYSQCVQSRIVNGKSQYGWTWNWPTLSNTVFSYPETVVGWKPWNGGKSTITQLPIKIKNISSFKWSYDVQVTAVGSNNLSTSMWLTKTGITNMSPTPSDIAAEFMIWTTGNTFNPAGTLQGTITVDSIKYEIWVQSMQTDSSGTNNNSWKYVAYRAVSGQTTSTILDIKVFLNDAVNRGFISNEFYVSDIELGNEIQSGSGTTWISNLNAQIN